MDEEKSVPESSTKEGYLKYSGRKVLFIAGMGALLIFLIIFAIKLGATNLTYGEIIHYIFHPDDSWNSTVVWDLRLKVIFGAVLAGAALGIAGSVMQSILRNPMASPYTLGLSNASAFGAALAILFAEGGVVIGQASAYVNVSNPLLVTSFAFACAMIATGVMIVLVKVVDSSPETIILAGLAISSIFSAGLAFLQYIASDVALSAIVYWQFGNISKVTWMGVRIIAVALLIIAIYFYLKRWDYNAMESGEDVAVGLGVKISRTRFIGLTVASVITAIVVSFVGIIGFVGLIGPHIVKKFVGNDSRFVLPGSMIIGAFVLLLAFIVGSNAFSVVIPVGIITSAIGGPLFIAILISRRRRRI